MKVVTLNYYRDNNKFWQTAVLFVITKPNNIDDFSFTECLKECLKLYVSIEHLPSNITDETLKQYAETFLKNIRFGKNSFWINDSTYLESENVKTV